MTRCVSLIAVLAALQVSVVAGVLAADMDVRPFVSHPYRDDRRPRPDFNDRTWSAPPPLPRNESPQRSVPATPPPSVRPAPREVNPAPKEPDAGRRKIVAPVPAPPAPVAVESPSPDIRDFLAAAVLLLLGASGLVWLVDAVGRLWKDSVHAVNGRQFSVAAARVTPANKAVDTLNPKQAGSSGNFMPSQEGWAHRASTVRNPVSGFVFRFQARANARAMAEEQNRVKTARATTKEYTGLLKDLVEGQDAATAYGVRRDLASELYELERTKLQDAFDESSHHRRLAAKRRDKEAIESDTRRIEAQHEQEAVERFKEPKFAAGLARFEEKQKGYQVGAASADAAIAETKVPAKPEADGNENADVLQLHALLQSALQAVEQGEQRGADTQVLRKRVELLKQLLNLV